MARCIVRGIPTWSRRGHQGYSRNSEHAARIPARFAREARSISGLNHPNICSLYTTVGQEGETFLI